LDKPDKNRCAGKDFAKSCYTVQAEVLLATAASLQGE
jgi:hypothetical protein